MEKESKKEIIDNEIIDFDKISIQEIDILIDKLEKKEKDILQNINKKLA